MPATPVAHSSNLRAFFSLLWRRRLVIALVMLVVGSSVALGLAFAPREYTAVARVAAMPPQDVSQSPANYADLLGTVADVAESRPVLTEVSEALGERSLEELGEQVVGDVVSGTVLIQVSATDRDPVMAARIANAVVAALPAHDPSNGSFVFTTTEPAAVPASFASPNVQVTVLAGVLLALALSVGAAAVYDKVTRTVDDPDEAGDATGGSVLGVVPRPRDPRGVPADEPDSAEFPSLRALRVALEFASSEEPTRTLVVAPAVADPWSGWLEVNLAVSLAEVGHRVLLVDAHRGDRTRHPALSSEGPGLYDLLAGTADLPSASVAGPVDGVTVVPLGNPDLAAPSLLEMRARDLLDGIDEAYDVVLVHTAPVTESDDARILAIGGSLLLTVPSGRVKRQVLESAAERIRGVGVRLLGTVLVGVRPRR